MISAKASGLPAREVMPKAVCGGFDDVAHKAVPVARLRTAPSTGHLTGR
jgi:hypothetical protein